MSTWRNDMFAAVQGGKISMSTVKELADRVVQDVLHKPSHIKYYVGYLNEITRSCKSNQNISVLYIIDAIIRAVHKIIDSIAMKQQHKSSSSSSHTKGSISPTLASPSSSPLLESSPSSPTTGSSSSSSSSSSPSSSTPSSPIKKPINDHNHKHHHHRQENNHSSTNDILQIFYNPLQSVLENNEKKILETTPEDHCKKLIKLLNVWIVRNDFDILLIKRWTNRIVDDLNINIDDVLTGKEDKSSSSMTTTTITTTTTSSMQNDKKRKIGDHHNFDINSVLDPNYKHHKGSLASSSDHLATTMVPASLLVNHSNQFEILPNEMVYTIISYLDFLDLIRVSFVSRSFYNFVFSHVWKKLSFENQVISSFHLRKIVHTFSYVTHINLAFCLYVDNEAILTLSKYCHQLETIILSGCKIDQDPLVELVSQSPFLKYLNISQNPSSFSSKTLFRHLFKRIYLRKLNISCCHSLIFLLLQAKKIPKSLKSINIDCYCGHFNSNLFQYKFGLETFLEKHKSTVKKMRIIEKIDIISSVTLIDTNIWKKTLIGDELFTKNLILTEKHSSINERCLLGQTPLHVASSNGKISLIDILLEGGANYKILDLYGQSPLMVSKTIFIAQKLLEKGVRAITEFEKSFSNVIPIIVKYFNFLRPVHMLNKSTEYHPTEAIPQDPLEEELLILLEYVSKVYKLSRISSPEIFQQSQIILSLLLKNMDFFKLNTAYRKMSQDLIWSIIKKNNAFRMERAGVVFSSEPGNLRNMNSPKYSGLARSKVVDVAAKDGKIVVSSKVVKKTASPATANKTTTFNTVNYRRTARFVKNLTSQYAPELRAAALGRLHRLQAVAKNQKAAAKKATKN
ncbi:hypothetical protein CYY_005965 [Polysphondylium violaceum]|uniref:F-box domain-containing protein n=1 Tax=Polysphondylium violaceum TaxID=133409 RepID=A0A8J4PU95_9MYCE|nr:hypothetical protein CYY_005965 [Polysphondylium violaceum]